MWRACVQVLLLPLQFVEIVNPQPEVSLRKSDPKSESESDDVFAEAREFVVHSDMKHTV
jgi:hypothetical protein